MFLQFRSSIGKKFLKIIKLLFMNKGKSFPKIKQKIYKQKIFPKI